MVSSSPDSKSSCLAPWGSWKRSRTRQARPPSWMMSPRCTVAAVTSMLEASALLGSGRSLSRLRIRGPVGHRVARAVARLVDHRQVDRRRCRGGFRAGRVRADPACGRSVGNGRGVGEVRLSARGHQRTPQGADQASAGRRGATTTERVRTRTSQASTYGRTSATSSPGSECRRFTPLRARLGVAVGSSVDAGETRTTGGRWGINGRRCLPLGKYRALVSDTARRIRLSTLLSSYR